MSSDIVALRQFTVKFFSQLGANVLDNGETISVSGIPLKFQKFYGKNEPYTIAFDSKYSSLSIEVVTSESYLLKTMRSYLDNTGESVLQRLKFNLPIDSILKDKLTLRNCTISKINTNLSYLPILKFTFQTSYKYMNDENKIVTDIFIDSKMVIEPDFKMFIIDSLKDKNFDISEIKENYELAKNKLRDRIESKTKEISIMLENGLSNEIKRIEEHNLQQIKEVDTQINKAKARNINFDVSNYEAQKKQAINEKNLQIQNEEKKYSLKISTKLLTTSVIMRPIYNLEVFFKTKEVTRLIVFNFDPLYNRFNLPSCDDCKNEISEIVLCNGNHVVCKNCGDYCEDCGQISCIQCLKNKCVVTHRKLCKQCGTNCIKCRAFKHKRFFVKDSVGRYLICTNCS
jgi:hypothetical protein